MKKIVYLLVYMIIPVSFFTSCKETKEHAAPIKDQTKITSVEIQKDEDFRPNFHFTPQNNWMNDPNGMFYFNGYFHLFFQYYPDDNVWGPMHWGHAISSDMISWKEQPIAIYPDEKGYIFSGSAVVDKNNTSGFGKDGKTPIVAMFTYHDPKGEEKAVKLMIDVKNIMENLSINYWIEGGTLLGAIRDQKLIPWDHDIDMGMVNHSNDIIKKMIRHLKKKFYVSIKTFSNMEGVWDLGKYRVIKVYPKKYFFLKQDLCLDIFIYYNGNIPNMNNEVYKYVVWGKNAFHKKEFFDTLEKIEFYGELINVPSNYREFLKIKYGADWATPKKQWNVAIDDGSILKS